MSGPLFPTRRADAERWDHWLELIAHEGVNLTTWEETFIDSLRAQRALGRPLTEKQVPILERIYTERTP